MTPEQLVENILISNIKTNQPHGIYLCKLAVDAAIRNYESFNYINLDSMIKAAANYIKIISVFDKPLTARQFSERHGSGIDSGRELLKKCAGIYQDARRRPHLFFIEPITEVAADEIRLFKNGRQGEAAHDPANT